MTSTDASSGREWAERPHYREEQRFPWWIKAVPLLVAAALGGALVPLWLAGPPAASVGLVVALFFFVLHLPLVALHFLMNLVVVVDPTGLRIRAYPLRGSMLPSRMTRKDVALDDIDHWQACTHNSLAGTEFWGWHFWGLSAGKDGRYLYVMRPDGPVTARGVELRLKGGEKLFIGSKRPAELVDAITRLKG
jgi:hypothetical protein